MEAEIESRVTKMVSVKVKRLEEEISRYKTEAAKLRSAKVTLEASMLALKEERQAFEARLASADQEQAAKAAKDRERLKKERRVMERQVRAQLHMPNRKDRMEMEALQATIAKMKVTAQKKEGRWKVTERRMKDRIDTLGERVAELESSLKFSHAGQQQQQRRIEQLEHEAQELETRNRMQEFREIGRASGGGDGGKGKGDLVMQNHEMLKEMYPDSNDLPVGAAGMDFDRAQAQDKDDASNATGPQESLRQQYLEQQALMRLKRLQQKGQQQQQQQQQHEKAQPSIVDVSLSDHHKDVVIDQNRKVAAFHESIEKETASSGISGYRTPYNPEAYDTGNDDDEEENVQDTGTEDEQTYFRAGQDSERWNQADGMAPKLDFDYSSVGNNRGIAGLESSGARPSDQTKKNMSNEKVSFYADTLRRSYGSEGINETRASRGDRVDVTSERNDVMQGGRESLEGSSEGQDVPDGEDSGQLIVYEDGKRERRFKSGRRQLWFRNGTEKEIGSDGSATVRFANGDIKKTHTDTGLVVYFYASANTTHTTYGNGVEIFEFPNGQTEKHHPNGLKEISFADKTRKVVYPNGDQLSIFPDGKTLRETKDGTIISSDADSQSKN
jgi:centromere protein J